MAERETKYIGRDLHYDLEGMPIDLATWARLLENMHYKRVAYTQLPNGWKVSTVWLGLDHCFGLGPPLIFETMVFPIGDCFEDMEQCRCTDLATAKETHRRIVYDWSKREACNPAHIKDGRYRPPKTTRPETEETE